MKNIFSFLFIAILTAGISAQRGKDFETVFKTCGNFKMPIIVPPSDFDSSFIVKPVFGQNSKIISINPCGETENEQAETRQNAPFKALFVPKKQ